MQSAQSQEWGGVTHHEVNSNRVSSVSFVLLGLAMQTQPVITLMEAPDLLY